MKAQEFNKLAMDEKARLILQKGFWVQKALFMELEISLYRIDGLYYELRFNPVIRKVTLIRSLKGVKINPYLKYQFFNNLN